MLTFYLDQRNEILKLLSDNHNMNHD